LATLALLWTMSRTVLGDFASAASAVFGCRGGADCVMTPDLQLILAFVLFLGLLAAGMTIPFAITLPAIVYLYLQDGFAAFNGIGLVSWGSMNSFTLTAIPLFILMAELMQQSGLSLRVYRGLARLVSRIPGGLLQTNIVGCALFAAVSGSSIATGCFDRQRSRCRSSGSAATTAKLSAGSLAAGGTLGILLPPSIAMIVYGTFSETSVAKLFMAGVIPGLMLAGMFMVLIAVRAILRPSLAPREHGARTLSTLVRALIDVVPFTILIGGILGSIYTGFCHPDRGGGGRLHARDCHLPRLGRFDRCEVRLALRRTIEIIANILFIIYAAFLFSYAISYAGIGEDITAFIVGMKLDRLEFFLALFVLYTVLGCLVESLGMIVITVPLLYPALLGYGIDPVWFGIILVIFIELGQISPPIGINLFVIQASGTAR
jgi:tripartite ATP-independent transporter DctM subunit